MGVRLRRGFSGMPLSCMCVTVVPSCTSPPPPTSSGKCSPFCKQGRGPRILFVDGMSAAQTDDVVSCWRVAVHTYLSLRPRNRADCTLGCKCLTELLDMIIEFRHGSNESKFSARLSSLLNGVPESHWLGKLHIEIILMPPLTTKIYATPAMLL